MTDDAAAAERAQMIDARSNRDWWPNQLDVSRLHANPPAGDPMGADFDYAAGVPDASTWPRSRRTSLT